MNTLNVIDIEKEGLSIYPNPNYTENVNIEIPQNEYIESINIISISGQFYKSDFSQTGSKLTLNTNELPIGTYLIKLNSSNKIYYSKLINNYKEN